MSDSTPPQSTWKIEAFDKHRHDRSAFDCGVASLNEWLTTLVSQYDKRELLRTYVLVEEQQPIVRGYYTLLTHAVAYAASTEARQATSTQADSSQVTMPVVRLGRLAIEMSVHGQGLGEFLLLDALRRAEYLATQSEICAVQVDAASDSARRFYAWYGFASLAENPQLLFLPIATIRQLKLPPL